MPGLSAPVVTRGVQIAAGLRAAFLLAQGKEDGLRFTLLSMEGAARSFWAAAICLVPFLAIRAIGEEGFPSEGLGVELVGYLLGWVAFPLASAALVDASGRGPLWPLFVAAWNWSNLAQYAALMAAVLFGRLLPGGLGGMLSLLAIGYALWMEWFVTKSALRISGARAGMFVLLDLAIGILIATMVDRLS
ncbi:hypothetical protein VQH23_22070 [Pararoseomonas sp. SCSIO 73927]|uniref:hypothetical protein n=1 Tax=Pararoseomonas sp. SCSIO 73927 TaxID=3114537 RepID=UPI0030D137BE